MRLHLLTALTRPENLERIAYALAGAESAGVDLHWHIRPGLGAAAVGGQAHKNALLDSISDGWCYILDDDNSIHPGLFAALAACVAAHPDARLIAIAQQHKNGWVRQVERSMLRQTHVDAGQVVIRKDAIGDLRIPLHYCGDGEWIEQIANSLEPSQITYIREPMTYYNWLRDT